MRSSIYGSGYFWYLTSKVLLEKFQLLVGAGKGNPPSHLYSGVKYRFLATNSSCQLRTLHHRWSPHYRGWKPISEIEILSWSSKHFGWERCFKHPVSSIKLDFKVFNIYMNTCEEVIFTLVRIHFISSSHSEKLNLTLSRLRIMGVLTWTHQVYFCVTSCNCQTKLSVMFSFFCFFSFLCCKMPQVLTL